MRLLLIVAVFLAPITAQEFRAGKVAFLPVICAIPKPGKCVAGELPPGEEWCSHHWSPCWQEPGCVDAMKNEVGEHPWLTREKIAAILEKCDHFIVGNEPNLAGMSLEDQAALLKEINDIARNSSKQPACKIIFGGVLVDSPQLGDGAWWPSAFWQTYEGLYGPLTEREIGGVHVHAYWWDWDDPWRFVAKTDHMAARVREVCPWCEVWLTETGSLLGREEAVQAMKVLPAVNARAVFWFVTQGWPGISLYEDGELNDLGRMYKEAW
jgi:hypothetical protein